jgi:acyl-CoA dehydrogenase
MDFSLSDDERAFQDAVRRFGDTVLRPNERRIDSEGRIPDEVLRGMADLGLLAMTVPEEYGGLGASAVLTEIAAEEIGRGDFSMATAVFFLLEAGWSWVLSRHGTEEAKREVLPPVCAGKAFLGIATTEPAGGSDLANLRTASRRDGDGFVVRGEKSFLSGVEEAKRLGGGHLTLTRAENGDGRGFNFLYVPTRSHGISTQKFENMGRMGVSTGGISYDGVRVPAQYLVGREGRGFDYAMEGFSVARTFVSAACVGAAERALETGTQWIRERQAFGRPLGKFEGIQFELVDLYTQVEAVKWQCRRAAWLLDTFTLKGDTSHRSEVDRAVASVKLSAPQVAFETVKRVMMWFGAAGYTKDVGLELGFRGIMSYLVGAEGGLNIMRIILGRELLGKEFVPYR